MSFRSPRPNRRPTGAHRPTLECLESRRLLSAVLLNDINPGTDWSAFSGDVYFGFGFSRELISCMNSETSRNSLYTLAKRT